MDNSPQLDVCAIEACDTLKQRLRDGLPYLRDAVLDALIAKLKSDLTAQ